MIQSNKLLCFIPSDTTTWFIYNYNNLKDRMIDLTEWTGLQSDRKGDLRIDINRESPRFVILYLQSSLEKHTAEFLRGYHQATLNDLHCIQGDDRDTVDQRFLLQERGY